MPHSDRGTVIVKRGETHILTTHVGSLPRNEAMLAMLDRREQGDPPPVAEFNSVAHDAVADIVQGQIDCPDLAMCRHTSFQDLSDDEFVQRAGLHGEVRNHALRNVPADRVRVHVCWGNYEAPHTHDIVSIRCAGIQWKQGDFYRGRRVSHTPVFPFGWRRRGCFA